MGLFGKKKEWDTARSDAGKAAMREIFNKAVPDGETYQIGYGYSQEVRMMNYIVVRTSTTTIQSLVIGWRESDMSIVIVATTPEFDNYAEPEFYRKSEIKKAKLAGPQREYYIVPAEKRKPPYALFGLYAEYDEDYFAYIWQQDEWEAFGQFWKQYAK